MYSLPYYKEKDPQVIREFIAQYPFAFLSGSNLKGEPVATQVPGFLEEKDGKQILTGHMMKNTDHHLAFAENPHVLMVFTGPSTYVSGTWYSNPNTPSTWNYMSVHLRGKIRFTEGEELKEIVRKTSLHFEDNDPDSPTILDHLAPRMVDSLMTFIVGFEIEVQAMDHVFKLSQDRNRESYLNIIEKLSQQGRDAQAIAEVMQGRIGKVFPDL